MTQVVDNDPLLLVTRSPQVRIAMRRGTLALEGSVAASVIVVGTLSSPIWVTGTSGGGSSASATAGSFVLASGTISGKASGAATFTIVYNRADGVSTVVGLLSSILPVEATSAGAAALSLDLSLTGPSEKTHFILSYVAKGVPGTASIEAQVAKSTQVKPSIPTSVRHGIDQVSDKSSIEFV